MAVVRAEAGIQENLACLLGERWFPFNLQECLVTLLVHILPYLAVLEVAEAVEEKVKHKISLAKLNYQTLLQYFTEEVSLPALVSWFGILLLPRRSQHC